MTHESEIDFEAEYNCRAMVPEHPQLIEQWGRDAAAFRAGATADLDAKYGPDARHCIDIFTPVTDRNGPVAMFVHGGYWSNFDGKWFSHMASGMVAHGIPVAVPSYRLCPDVQIADIIADIRQACAWLHRRFGRPVLPVGHSAGGHLAAALLATDWPAHDDEMPPDLVKAAVSISGLFDLAPLINVQVNQALGLTPATAADASPLLWPAPAGSWLHNFVGADESDEFHRQSERIVEIWGESGVSTNLIRLMGMNHFTAIDPLTDPDSEMVAIIAALAHSLE